MNERPLRRIVSTAAAALVALAAAAPAAMAAEPSPDVFAGTAEALSLEVRLTGPAEVIGQLAPDGSDTLVQRISHTDAVLRSEGDDQIVARLGKGALEPFNVGTSSDDPGGERQEMHSFAQGPLEVDAGVIEWEIVDDALSRSFSELAMIRVSLAPVLAELPDEARAPLQDAVADATGNVNQIVGELNGVLGQLEDTVNEARGEAPVDIPDVLPETLPVVPDVASVDLLTARKLWSESTVETVDGLVRSTARGGVAELSLLGGLVRVPALEYVSTAEAGGLPGTAAASTEVETIAVEVGDYQVEVAGSTLRVGDVEIDLTDPELEGVPLEDIVAEVEQLLTDLVAAGGLSIDQGEGATDVAEDGSSAAASTSAFALRLRPLNAAAAPDTIDLAVEMLPTKASVAAAAAPPVAAETPAMPRTGGGTAIMVLGLLGMGTAVALRNRLA